MRQRIRTDFLAIMFLTLCGLIFTSYSFAQEFSADMVNRMGKKTMNSKLYVGKEMVRMEMAEAITIIRNDKKVSWMIMPSEKMYMENSIDASTSPKVAKEFDGELTREALGKEDVDGQPADKFKVTYTDNGKTTAVYQWLRDGKIPVKIESVDGKWSMEYKNIKEGPQSADLFEPPAGYTKMEMPSFGNIMKGMDQTEQNVDSGMNKVEKAKGMKNLMKGLGGLIR